MVGVRLCAVICAGGLLATPSLSNAAGYVATFGGTVSSGEDSTGLFGTPGNLAGSPFTLLYKFNDSLGDLVVDPGVSSTIFGGAFYGYPDLAS